jgi:hypothetical protein
MSGEKFPANNLTGPFGKKRMTLRLVGVVARMANSFESELLDSDRLEDSREAEEGSQLRSVLNNPITR